MAYSKRNRPHHSNVRDAVDNCVDGTWNIPVFQRPFVWKTSQIADLADSLYRKFPVGSIVLWEPLADTTAEAATSLADGDPAPDHWIVDGQQRLTALCLLTGRRPRWFSPAEWQGLLAKHRVVFDPRERTFARYGGKREATVRGKVLVRDLLAAEDSPSQVSHLASQLTSDEDERDKFAKRFMEVIRELTSAAVGTFEFAASQDEVALIFDRINNNGRKVSGFDLCMSLAAIARPAWVRDELRPFAQEARLDEWGVTTTDVMRSFLVRWKRQVRFNRVADEDWTAANDGFEQAWRDTKNAWLVVRDRVNGWGIPDLGHLSTRNLILPLVLLASRWPDALDHKETLRWHLATARTLLNEDDTANTIDRILRVCKELLEPSHHGWDDAIRKTYEQLGELVGPDAGSFRLPRNSTSADARFARLLLNLLLADRDAHDWARDLRVGLPGCPRDDHHIYPDAWLRSNAVDLDADDRNALANMTWISPATNRESFQSKAPWEYLREYDVDDKRLQQHLVEPSTVQHHPTLSAAEAYDSFLASRAQKLAAASQELLNGLPAHPVC